MLKAKLFNLHNQKNRDYYYPIVCEWWKNWANWKKPIAWQMLPTTGLMIFDKDEPLCAGWLYQTDSLICVIDFFISNPKKIDRKLRKEAINLLIVSLEEIANLNGFKAIYTSIKNPSLIQTLINLDFGKDSDSGFGEKGMTVFIKKI